jgi:hypothetical protein
MAKGARARGKGHHADLLAHALRQLRCDLPGAPGDRLLRLPARALCKRQLPEAGAARQQAPQARLPRRGSTIRASPPAPLHPMCSHTCELKQLSLQRATLQCAVTLADLLIPGGDVKWAMMAIHGGTSVCMHSTLSCSAVSCISPTTSVAASSRSRSSSSFSSSVSAPLFGPACTSAPSLSYQTSRPHLPRKLPRPSHMHRLQKILLHA